MPLLQLLVTYQTALPSTPKTHKIIDSLENLLAKHIIFPARVSFLSSKRTKVVSDEEANSSLYKDLLTPLSKNVRNNSGDISQIQTLYSTAVRCTPRETAKQRITENPWLQLLFRHLFESASSMSSSSSTLDEISMRKLKALLNQAIDHNVPLDISLLEMLLSKFSGILSKEGGLNIVDWDLVGSCIKLNPDVFVLRSPQRASNILLTSLFTRITERCFGPPRGRSDKYEEILSDVVLPLVQAFAHARDLLRFIDHWKGELARFEELTEEVEAEPSIWEDHRLSQRVADIVDSALTTGQIRKVLIAAQSGLHPLVATRQTGLLSSSVILDCVINGCTSETTIMELVDTARSIYAFLLEIASGDKDWDTIKRWRVWRILTTINIRWPNMHANPSDKFAEQPTMRRALELIRCNNIKANYAEEVHCFNYIVNLAAVEKHGSEILDQPPNHTVRRAFEAVLSHQQISSDISSSEDWVASRQSGSAPSWNGRSDEVASVEILMMICQAQMLTSPEVLQ